MSSRTLEEVLDRSPNLKEATTRAIAVLRSLPSGFPIDPLILAKRAGLDEVQTLAALGILLQAGLGAFAIQILNQRGQTVAEYASLAEVPDTIADDYGELVDVEPRNTTIVFRPHFAETADVSGPKDG
jgi:hypothetical protein